MQKRPLGLSGLMVAPVILGGNVFGWTADEAASFAVLDAATDAGLNAIDTADVYSRWVPGHTGGESEAVIGRWLKARPGKRDQVVIITKVGSDMGTDPQGKPAKGLSRVVITEDAVPTAEQAIRPTLVTPQGYRIEGLEAAGLAKLLRALA